MNVQRFLLANHRRQASGANCSISSFNSSLSISSVDSSLSAVDSVDGFDRNRGQEAEAADRRMEWERQYREMEELGVFARSSNDDNSDDDSDDDSDDESSISSAESSSSVSSA
jgi:hypothetical protein